MNVRSAIHLVFLRPVFLGLALAFADMHRQWVEKEEFPPYEFSLDMGKEMFAKPFKNGKSYADCFANGGIGVRQNYPYFDEKEGKVVTLELALNRCREANGEPPLSYVKD